MTIKERIMERVTVDENGCHVYDGWRSKGYGRISLGGGAYGYTHRLMYEVANGPIPPGLHVDHLCRNRSCCNPDHLEAVTQSENNRRAAAANASPTAGVGPYSGSAINPWHAWIGVKGRQVHLGLFPTQEAALAARREAERTFWGRTADPERRTEIEAEVKALQGGAA